MAMYSTLTLVLLIYLSVKSMVPSAEACYLDSTPGGCPDKNACAETCRPCYRGIGLVYSYCVAPGGGLPYWICRCDMKNGAPCQPVGPPICPKPPATARYFNQYLGRNEDTTTVPPPTAIVIGNISEVGSPAP
ncbi:hypothetical protein A4A49_33486 [Nicotiana attenuata]|uniref:Uncharacterized protein n=1 Tax=Nicotiana attenuata TaxID=49451 RepID=A0A1J6II31_NICAT|nr:hypothetical protein A4A49_33486 [Nicotiana attenuata]